MGCVAPLWPPPFVLHFLLCRRQRSCRKGKCGGCVGGVGDQVVLAAELAAVNRSGDRFARPQKHPQRGGVADSMGEVEASGGAELGEQTLVQCLEHACLLPFLEAPPAGHTRAVAKLLRQLLPGDPGSQHEQDAGKGTSVIEPLPTRMMETALPDRQERLDQPQSSSSSHAVAIEDLLVWRVDSR